MNAIRVLLGLVGGNPLMAGLGIALALSLAGNALLFKLRDNALERASAAETRHAQATAAAKACSAGVARVRQEEAVRRAAVEKQAKAAETRARSAERRALATLQAQPSVPGNACASAEALARTWLQERRKRGAP